MIRKSTFWKLNQVLSGLLLFAMLAGCAPASTLATAQPILPPSPTPVADVPSPIPTEAQADRFTPLPVSPTQIPPEGNVNTTPIPTPSDPGRQDFVLQAMQDLAQRLNIDIARIDLVEMEEVVWPDGSLGCPQPGMSYTQALVDGMRIRLSVDGQIYNYHSGGGRPPFLCEQALPGGKMVP